MVSETCRPVNQTERKRGQASQTDFPPRRPVRPYPVPGSRGKVWTDEIQYRKTV